MFDSTRLLDRIQSRQARAGVVGLGYVGLPLAVEFARSGFVTTGIDLDARKVDAIRRGESYIPDVPSSEVTDLVSAGRLSATSDFAIAGDLDTVVPVSSPRVAEMVKLLENTFRAVNIGLVNEIALMCDTLGIDVWEVVDAAKTKPFGFMPFYPGPGLGGHCIPIDPFYLSWKARQNGFECRFIELAGHINAAMPDYVVDRVAAALNTARKPINGSRIHLLGVAYKRDVNDMRESPALDILELLSKRGAVLSYSDPYVPVLRHNKHLMTSIDLSRALTDRP